MLGFARSASRAPSLSLERTTALAALTATGLADISGLSGTIVSRGVPIIVRACFGRLQSNVVGNGINVVVLEDINDDGSFTTIGQIIRPVAAANGFNSGGAWERERPAQPVGTVIRYKIQAALIAAGASTTLTVNATDCPFTLRADHKV